MEVNSVFFSVARIMQTPAMAAKTIIILFHASHLVVEEG